MVRTVTSEPLLEMRHTCGDMNERLFELGSHVALSVMYDNSYLRYTPVLCCLSEGFARVEQHGAVGVG